MNRVLMRAVRGFGLVLPAKVGLAMALLGGIAAGTAVADPAMAPAANPSTVVPAAQPSTPGIIPDNGDSNRYGPLGIYDHRSLYGKGVFPEPFIVDDSDGEINELRLDWSHQRGKGQNSNTVTGEIEHGNGLWTLEVEVHYDYNRSNTFDSGSGQVVHSLEQGMDNVDLGARIPVFQYVSKDEFIDSTFGVGIEVGIPTNSPLSKNTEIVPKIFNDTRIGEHFTVQTLVGYSFLRGSGDEGGNQNLEYGMTLGWTFPHNELPIPGVQDFIPIFEFQGETLLNTHDGGANNLVGNLAFRANLYSIGKLQPRIGVGYLFPIDSGARADFHWGIYTSLVFEF